MEHFDFEAPAEVYASKVGGNARRPRASGPMSYRRFNSGGEAVQYVIEFLSSELRQGAVLESGEDRFTIDEIRELYDGAEYPLVRGNNALAVGALKAKSPGSGRVQTN